jgi:hypothetical protein
LNKILKDIAVPALEKRPFNGGIIFATFVGLVGQSSVDIGQ